MPAAQVRAQRLQFPWTPVPPTSRMQTDMQGFAGFCRVLGFRFFQVLRVRF